MSGSRNIFRFGVIAVLLISLFVADSMIASNQQKTDNKTQLIRPSFVDEVYASSAKDTVVADILNEEAGISAYMESTFSINLTSVRGTFSTIELETADYILGSIEFSDYPGNYDPHVYVHKDGWILAYYLRGDPVSKMIDARAQTIDSTLLYEAVSIIASNGGVPVTDVKYYDFRYPNATHMMFIAENSDDGDTFTINIPSSFGYFERSWASSRYNNIVYFYFDGTNLSELNSERYDNWFLKYGYISTGLFTSDIDHSVRVVDYGVIVIVYREP